MAPNRAQLDLLDWAPPRPVERFEPEQIKSAEVQSLVCRAVAAALRESKLSREEIAAQMSDYLGSEVPKSALDAYASQAREDHIINLPRFIALLHVLRDRRLLQAVADLFGWAVIDEKFLPLIELAAIQERTEQLAEQAKNLRAVAKRNRVL